ncbi:MAG: MarR family winged helix-turn-helix transcriptional regulator [Actinomycetes bacterium]
MLRLLTLAGQLLELEWAHHAQDRMPPADRRVLITLGLLGCADAGATATFSGIRPPTVTAVLGRLIAAGLVQDCELSTVTDRRVRMVELTDAGRSEAQRLTDLVPPLNDIVLDPLSSGERALLSELLHKVVRAQFDRLTADRLLPVVQPR